jgi:hypothetical protein
MAENSRAMDYTKELASPLPITPAGEAAEGEGEGNQQAVGDSQTGEEEREIAKEMGSPLP